MPTGLNGPFAAFKDAAGFDRSAAIARSLGFDGKQCIHPSQLETVNRVFAPTDEEVAHARRIVQAPEGRRIFGELTVEENLRLGLAGRRARSGSAAALDAVYELFPVVRDFRQRSAGALSGGQQQQLAIARALVAEPDVLLLDEPSLGLAPRVVDTVFEALGAIRERGLAVLLVEQRAQRTVAFADRTYVLANGELVTTLAPKDAGDTERLVAAYLGR